LKNPTIKALLSLLYPTESGLIPMQPSGANTMRRLLTGLLLVSSLGIVSSSANAAGIFEKLFGNQRQPANAGAVAAVSPIPREVVRYSGRERPGTIIVNSPERRLYFVLDDGTAVRYGVGVGRPGFEWGGIHRVSRMAEWPGWTPPAQMRKRRPDLPAYMAGGIQNPLGARAMYLGSSLYRIHGSNEPQTIGQAVSSGCIRMTNDDVTDLYDRVRVGTKVVIIRG
jgi:lipoprotein-anchoring transpeptidase ErfK/SrfK